MDESFQGLNGGAGYDLGSLLESGATLSADLKSVADQTRTLIDDSGPLLDGQVESADNTRLWARSLAGVTDQLVANDPQIRGLLQAGPGALGEASQLLDQIKPTLPILLANLSSLGQVAVTYRPSLEQLLVLLPPLPFLPPVVRTREQFDGNRPCRFSCTDGRYATMHRGLPATVSVAFTC